MMIGAGSGGVSPWTTVIRRVPASTLLAYVHAQWLVFAKHCATKGISLQDWKETDLTQALQAQLSSTALAGKQPFDGDFIAELSRYELDPKTCKPICVSRTDLEWILAGFPRFTIEFKLLDGSPKLRTLYWRDGLRKFIAGIYAPQASEAAMWAFLRTHAHEDSVKVFKLVAKRASQLACVTPASPLIQPSMLGAGIATCDTKHSRSVAPSPLLLAHIFIPLP